MTATNTDIKSATIEGCPYLQVTGKEGRPKAETISAKDLQVDHFLNECRLRYERDKIAAYEWLLARDPSRDYVV